MSAIVSIPTLLRCGALCVAMAAGTGVGRATESGQEAVTVHRAKPGPWGDLEFFEICLEPPTRHVLASGYLQSAPVWVFPAMPPGEIGALLSEAGLPPVQIDILLKPERVEMGGNRLQIAPPPELVQSLTPEVRAALYGKLSAWGENRFMANPFAMGNDTIATLAAAANHRLPPDLIDFANSMLYRRGAEYIFSDYSLAISRLPDDESRIEFTKIIMRARSQMVRLLITPSADLPRLRDYWGIGGMNPSILPLLDSVTGGGGADKIDIVHLLPPNARQLLFVYPDMAMAVGGNYPDCFWTALNFLEAELSDRNFDRAIEVDLGNRWRRVEPPLRLGDVILISEQDGGDPVHACNYIADDLVFTKNGYSLMRPFTIASLESMLANYHEQGATSVTFHRHRDVIASESP
jgi:hypothetical protein